MSWSISSTGKAKDVAVEIAAQAGKINLSDAGEMETVAKVADTIAQTLSTFDPEKPVSVAASGHMGFSDWEKKTGQYQNVSLSIQVIHFTA